jgi:hypothetical protein
VSKGVARLFDRKIGPFAHAHVSEGIVHSAQLLAYLPKGVAIL